MRLGSHLSVAGGVAEALRSAEELALESVQIFTANQRQWSPRPPSEEEIRDWFATRKAMGWDPEDPDRVVSHNSYLVNMASPDDAARTRSAALQRAELERCEALAVRRCVMHPGAHLSAPAPKVPPPQRPEACTPEEEAGVARLAAALDGLHRSLPGFKVVTCLENTAGAGSAIGYDLRHLAAVRARVREPERIGFCIDTCHATAAGYDLSTPAAAKAFMEVLDSTLGMERVFVLHLNDSKGALGSRLDRHEHIGDGCCGAAGFRELLRCKALAARPGILETPKEGTYRRKPWDSENVRRLKAIAAGSKNAG